MAKGWVGLEPPPFEREHPAIQVCAYGEPGIGKSTFFAGFPNPKIVFAFDTPGKLRAYLKAVVEAGGKELPEVKDSQGTRIWQAVNKEGKLAVRIELYRDVRVDAPEAFPTFQDRFIRFVEKEQQQWAGGFLDSATLMGLHARKWSQYDLNANVKGWKHYAVQTDEMEEQLILQFPSLECDAGVAMHVSKKTIEAEGGLLRAPNAPGRLLDTTGAGWPELYYMWIEVKPDGKKVRRLQTENDGKFQAITVLGVPDGTRAQYRNLWKHLGKK